MPIIIPQKLAQKGDLVVIPRKQYEEFLALQKPQKSFKTAKPTKEELRIFKEGEKAIKKGDFITLEALKKELGL